MIGSFSLRNQAPSGAFWLFWAVSERPQRGPEGFRRGRQGPVGASARDRSGGAALRGDKAWFRYSGRPVSAGFGHRPTPLFLGTAMGAGPETLTIALTFPTGWKKKNRRES